MDQKRTIYTIAKELNLSPGTISKILNQTGNVSEQTRERVLKYIKEVGYVPATSARMLKSKRTYSVGIVFTEESDVGLEHSFFSSILQHFKNFVEKEGYELSFIVKKLGQHELSYYDWVKNKKVDGVYIVVGNYDDQGLYELINSSIPCISTDMLVPGLHTVISDNEQGVKIVLDYIKDELKKEKVAFISGPTSSKAFLERSHIFEEYAKTLGLHQVSPVIYAESFGFTSGYNAAKELLNRKALPEVIFVSSDDIALGVMKYIKDAGYDIPNDIKVIGFDDIAFAKHFTPSLTTVQQDRKLLGETAGKLLIDLIEHPEVKFNEVVKLPVKLIKRASTELKND
ncbi:MAG: LacI family DNA-binding transcriptional regulator [Acholeplasmataceae bacterium]